MASGKLAGLLANSPDASARTGTLAKEAGGAPRASARVDDKEGGLGDFLCWDMMLWKLPTGFNGRRRRSD
jgi:hypothetical protein